ncbi:hypothetical protein HMPREF1624_05590 [Sporothrix schenckii ATCC 58251]|uniref:Anaphase-promoting complex subunit 4 WD40 domain-containing protein n=1 Tax=Sporothrix schenckii (strain ATCC 58251 / de Perez 2211183) TaxID=1391915 RepID=U7PP80_SPOS1|nr:hypothetical protein HMPREF1624_05590 [Sporothrix schenckii ATCC 58251]
MRAGRKKEDASDQASEAGEPRDEGSNALVFSSVVDSAGFLPHHKEPPRYIRVKLHNKKVKEFDKMFLAQELIGTRPLESQTDSRNPVVTVTTSGHGRKKTATGGAVWATEFSKDGQYLAAGGRDHVVRVWKVISTAEDRRSQEEEEAKSDGTNERLSAPVFLEKPVQEFKGHTGEILDLSWSKNNFLLSTSMDKTVRLWHTSREECLCTFKHKELVSKVTFHPKDDRFFLAGCLDATLRLWSIPDKSVAFSAQMSDMITAVAFSPDGKMAIAGLLSGFCYLLETEGLKPLTQIHVRSSRGRNAKGSKITGIVPMLLRNSRPGDAAILVTSTDARVRLYHLRDKMLDCKFKGHEHASAQLSASFSDDGKYVICGSESKKVFIWSASSSDAITKDRYPCETFDAHSDMVTTAIFAPVQTRQLLGASGDPVYDLCNPPPITLMSLEETLASQSGMSNNTLNHNEDGTDVTQSTNPPHPPRARPEESPAYVARSTHYDGNIIVTGGDTGIIKVFRQDCAAKKRKHESWETGSFGQKLGTSSRLVGRSGSIITRTSASSAAHSRRGSLSLPSHLAGNSTQIGGHPDSINRWRHDIEGGGSRPSSLVGSGIASVRSERSISPNKSSRTPLGASSGLASDARRQPYATATSSPLSPHFAPNQAGRSGLANSAISPTSTTFAATSRQPGKPVLPPAGENASTVPMKGTVASSSQAASSNRDSLAIDSATSRPSDETTESAPVPAEVQIQEPKDGHDLEQDDMSESNLDSVGSTPQPSMAYRADDGALRLDQAGASFGFWNLSRWKGISGLRTSLIGGGSSSNNAVEPPSPVGSTHSSDKGSEHGGEGKTAHTRRPSLGVNLLPKSPLSKSDTQASASAAANDGSSSAAATIRASQTRQKSSTGRSLLSPSIAIASDDGDGGPHDDMDHPHYNNTNLLIPGSRSHSPYGRRASSIVSRLSSEMTSTDGGSDVDGEHGDEGVEMRCTKCGGREFKARRVNGVQQLECSRCGKLLDGEKK